MDSIKYLYIDDLIAQATIIAKSLTTNKLKIVTEEPISNGDIHKKLKSENFDGVILDQRLIELGNDTRGTSIAQYLRSVSSEQHSDLKSLPIVLYSASDFKKDFYKEPSGYDLFDCIYFKEDVDLSVLTHELIALVEGYRIINMTTKLHEILKIDETDLLKIDYRLVDELKSRLDKNVEHNFALYLKNQIIDRNGVLIDENILAARLGVDIQQSGESWTNLKNDLIDFKYQGIFFDAWERWWMFKLEEWWEKEINNGKYLSELTAIERVDLINKKYGFDLIPAKKTEKSSSSEFWTVCYATKKPIDVVDGIRIKQEQAQPWQDDIYICIDELIKPTKQDLWIDVHTSDKKRAKEIRDKNIKKKI